MYIRERHLGHVRRGRLERVRRPAWLARLTVAEQSERFDLDCRRELLHARTIAGASRAIISSTTEPLTGPGLASLASEGCAQASRRGAVIHAQRPRTSHGIARHAIYPSCLLSAIYIPPIWRCTQTQFRSPGILRMSKSNKLSTSPGLAWPASVCLCACVFACLLLPAAMSRAGPVP
jgi:hypothetical protein